MPQKKNLTLVQIPTSLQTGGTRANKNKKKRKRKNKNQQSSIGQTVVEKPLPVTFSRGQKTGRMKYSNLNNSTGGITVTNKEYITDLFGFGGNWGVSFSEYLNPGSITNFPWLSSIAKNYESYRFRKLCFHFETDLPTTAPGKMYMSFDYDASDSIPINKQAQMRMFGAMSNSVFRNFELTCDFSDLNRFGKTLYVRTGALPPNVDRKTYDVGRLVIANSGSAVVMTGELYVSYVVDLITPSEGELLGTNPSLVLDADSNGGTGVTKANFLGTAAIKDGNYPLALPQDGYTRSFTCLRPANLLVCIGIDGVGILGDPTVTTFGTATVELIFSEIPGSTANYLGVFKIQFLNKLDAVNFAFTNSTSISKSYTVIGGFDNSIVTA
jgi:hypothetical protein